MKEQHKKIASIYSDHSYLENNENWHEEDSPYKASLVEKMIKRNHLEFTSCADLGCGAGLVTELLAQKFSTTYFCGYDLSDDVKKFWNQRSILNNLEFKNKNLGEENSAFDVVICLDVFEHVEDYYGFLRSVKSSGKNFIFNFCE